MGSMMTKQHTAKFALRFATLACDIAHEHPARTCAHEQIDHAGYVALSRAAGDLIEQAGFIQALAQEAATLDTSDQGEVDDFEANWRMALNWWNQQVQAFYSSQEWHTQWRIELHMEEFWDELEAQA